MEAHAGITLESDEERARRVRLEFLASHKKPQSLHEDMQERRESEAKSEAARAAAAAIARQTVNLGHL